MQKFLIRSLFLILLLSATEIWALRVDIQNNGRNFTIKRSALFLKGVGDAVRGVSVVAADHTQGARRAL